MGESNETTEKAERLSRLGTYDIKLCEGTNPPALTVTGEALTTWWRELVEYCVGTRARRREAAKEVDAAWSSGQSASSVVQWRYGMKIEIKSAEAVVALLHDCIAPGAPFLCDDRCAHVRAGADAAQVKRFLDSIDAEIAKLRRRWKDCPFDHPCYEDLQDEFGIYEQWRKRLVTLATPVPGAEELAERVRAGGFAPTARPEREPVSMKLNGILIWETGMSREEMLRRIDEALGHRVTLPARGE